MEAYERLGLLELYGLELFTSNEEKMAKSRTLKEL